MASELVSYSSLDHVHAHLHVHCTCTLKAILVGTISLLMLLLPVVGSSYPPIPIRTMDQYNDDGCPWGCRVGEYCRERRCVACQLCPDPYTLKAMGEEVIEVIPQCFYRGSCPEMCMENNIVPKANITMCLWVNVTPPPPVEVTCKEGCDHGTCEISGQCICNEGWRGELCDGCALDCLHGVCNASGVCVCTVGWAGSLCNQDVTICGKELPCLNGGSCVPQGDKGYICECLQYYTGLNCENDETVCGDNQPCANGGTCLADGSGRYTCKCTKDFTGSNCNQAANQQLCPNQCPANTTCVKVSANNYQCLCDGGSSEMDCKEDTDKDNPTNWLITFIAIVVPALIAIVVIIFMSRCCLQRRKRADSHHHKSDSGIQLISGQIEHTILGEGALLLRGLQGWPGCGIHSCVCLGGQLAVITDGMTEYRVENLRPGLTYCFEVRRPSNNADPEEGCISVADCEITLEGEPDDSQMCSATCSIIANNVQLQGWLNSLLAREGSIPLRTCLADFFQLRGLQREVVVNPGKAPKAAWDTLYDIVCTLEQQEHPLADLLRLMSTSGGKLAGAEDMAALLAKAHPDCAVCAALCHRMHGGLSTAAPTQSLANNTPTEWLA